MCAAHRHDTCPANQAHWLPKPLQKQHSLLSRRCWRRCGIGLQRVFQCLPFPWYLRIVRFGQGIVARLYTFARPILAEVGFDLGLYILFVTAGSEATVDSGMSLVDALVILPLLARRRASLALALEILFWDGV